MVIEGEPFIPNIKSEIATIPPSTIELTCIIEDNRNYDYYFQNNADIVVKGFWSDPPVKNVSLRRCRLRVAKEIDGKFNGIEYRYKMRSSVWI